MSSVADSLISTATRPLRLRMRPDLVARGHRYLGRSYWVVKEPLALKYFRFQEEEYAILQMLDGNASLDDIKHQFETQFRPQKIELQDVHQFVAQLHRNGLVTSSAHGQGRSLYVRLGEVRQRELMQKLSSILALRFKGVDPQRFLDATYPLVRWLFHPPAVAIWFVLAIAAGLLVIVNFDIFQSRLPSFQQFFGPHNWLLLACVLAVTKIIHELGHGYSCKHFGGECHEIGVMMLVLTPCLYCNVSDSWLLRNKWHRAAIGAAGMYIEVLMASLATFVWWFTEPGFVNHIALQVMFICSVSTILFNGNPLLRYDGYYIISDILEIPNLRQKASQVLQRLAATWCLGLELPENPFLPPAQSGAVRALYDRVDHLSLGGSLFNHVFSEPVVRTVWAQSHRPNDDSRQPRRHRRNAGGTAGAIPRSARETRSGETQKCAGHAWRRRCAGGLRAAGAVAASRAVQRRNSPERERDGLRAGSRAIGKGRGRAWSSRCGGRSARATRESRSRFFHRRAARPAR